MQRSNIKGIFALVVVSIFLSISLPILAQEGNGNANSIPPTSTDISQEVQEDENITPQDLGISMPKLLPDSPFYFLKGWARKVRSFFTFNPVAKARIEAKYASEKLMEAKELAKKTKNPKILEKAVSNYEKQMDRIKNVVDKIKDKAEKNPKVASFLDKFTHQQILHDRILEKLEEKVPTSTFQKIKAARERHLRRFGEVMQKLEERTKIPQRLEKNLEGIKGSRFKDFKNLQILKELEERVPTTAKEAIRKARERILDKLKKKLEKASITTQERFKEYIDKIQGEGTKKMEILQNIMSSLRDKPLIRERLNRVRENILEAIQKGEKKKGCPSVSLPSKDFCPQGRIIPQRDNNGCIISFRCLTLGERRLPKELNRPTSTRRAVCPAIFDPVCGANGKVYSNSCWAKAAGVKVLHKGYCTATSTAPTTSPNLPIIGRMPKNIIHKSCQIACQEKEFSTGVCRKWPITPKVKWGCGDNETNIGQTIDCYVPQGLVGIGKTCCCAEKKINETEKKNKQSATRG